MANTYTLIASTTLGSTATSVTFSSLPTSYTDLIIRCTARSERAVVGESIYIYFNNSTTSSSVTRMTGNGSTANSTSFGDENRIIYGATGSSATSDTFGSAEIYIPNYNGSKKKCAGAFGVSETNATAASMGASASLWANTSAITDIKIELDSAAANIVAGSSFFLYGIKNS